MSSDNGFRFAGYHPIISCEGTAEQVAVEILANIREGAWRRWHGGRMKPSDFCKQELGMHEVKREGFLKSYWDADSLTAAAKEYKRLSKIPKGELCLADLIL